MTETKLSAIELEMQKAQEAFARKMDRLKKKAADEEKRIITKLVEILQDEDGEYVDVYEEVRAKAVEQLEQERIERSKAAKAARGTDHVGTADVDDGEDDEEVDTSDSESFAFQRSA